MMFNRKASPTRSAKSGNSITSSTNSVRSTLSPKVTANGQSRTSSVATVQKTRPTQPSLLKNHNSKPSSFDEDAPIPEGLVRCELCKRNFSEGKLRLPFITFSYMRFIMEKIHSRSN